MNNTKITPITVYTMLLTPHSKYLVGKIMVNSILITPATQGDRGTRGGFGLPGIKGVKGMKGDMGEKGMMGDEGLNGTRGRAGKCSPRFMCLWIARDRLQ